MIGYEIKTDVLSGGRIRQEVQCEFEGIMQTVSRQVIFTQDAQAKAALIQLGWTPPGHSPLGKKEGMLCGVIDIVVDPSVPEDEIRMTDHTLKILGRLLHIQS